MSRLFWLGMAMISCLVMFAIKYAVQSLDDELAKVKKQTVAAQLEIRVLHAEWSYLTQPERLAELNRQFLSLAPIATKQLQQNIAEIPLRTMPDPPVELTAAASPPPAPQPPMGLILPVSAPQVAAPAATPAPARSINALFAQTAAARTTGIDRLFAQVAEGGR